MKDIIEKIREKQQSHNTAVDIACMAIFEMQSDLRRIHLDAIEIEKTGMFTALSRHQLQCIIEITRKYGEQDETNRSD